MWYYEKVIIINEVTDCKTFQQLGQTFQPRGHALERMKMEYMRNCVLCNFEKFLGLLISSDHYHYLECQVDGRDVSINLLLREISSVMIRIIVSLIKSMYLLFSLYMYFILQCSLFSTFSLSLSLSFSIFLFLHLNYIIH